jgi:hypothetical protein
MVTLLNKIYYKARKEEIEKANIRFRIIKIDTIMESLIKLCWKYNLQYEVIIKTNDMLTIKFIGNQEAILLKYHKTDMVLKEAVDFFMNEIDENRANKGVYITTGKFEKSFKQGMISKNDCVLEDGFTFIKRHLGIKGKAVKAFKIENLNFFKYLPQ